MKKVVFLFAMMLMSIGAFAQSADEIITNYRNNSSIQFVDVNKDMIGMVAAQAKTEEEKAALKCVDSMVMGMIGTDDLAKEIATKLEALKDKGYTSKTANVEGNDMKFYIKQEGETITEIVMVAKAQGMNMLTQMKGKFDAKQAAALMNK